MMDFAYVSSAEETELNGHFARCSGRPWRDAWPPTLRMWYQVKPVIIRVFRTWDWRWRVLCQFMNILLHVSGTFLIELLPDHVGRFADSGFLDQLPRHRAHQVLVGVKRLQAFAGELSFHHERYKHLPAHQSEADLLHRSLVC